MSSPKSWKTNWLAHHPNRASSIRAATFLAALLAASLPSHAGVFKCVEDGTGKITFSDTPCPSNAEGGRIVVKPTNQFDGSGYRQKAAEDRWEDAARYNRKAQEEQDAADARAEAAARRAQQQAAEPAPRRSRSAMPVQGPAPSTITSCDGAGCWDNRGGRYNSAGGNLYVPPGGGPACMKIAGQMTCP
jgi:hypothetical protein